MAAPAKQIVKQVPAWRVALAKWTYSKSYFNQLGLWHDDCIDETTDVKEAIRRLPGDLYDERVFRISRALHLSNKKIILPKEEWTKFEEDKRYLQPYLDEVLTEKDEKAEWNRK